MVQILYRPPRPRSMDSISRTLRWSRLALIQHSLSDSIVYTKDMEDSFSGPFWMTKKSKWVLYLASKGRLLAYNDNERMVILHFLLQYIFISIIAIGQSNDIIVVDISAHGIYKTDKTRNTVKVAGREIGLVDGFGTCSKCDSPHVNIFMAASGYFMPQTNDIKISDRWPPTCGKSILPVVMVFAMQNQALFVALARMLKWMDLSVWPFMIHVPSSSQTAWHTALRLVTIDNATNDLVRILHYTLLNYFGCCWQKKRTYRQCAWAHTR